MVLETFEDSDLGQLVASTVLVGAAMAFATAVLVDDRTRRTLLDPLARVLLAAADRQKKADDQQRQARGTSHRAAGSGDVPKKKTRDAEEARAASRSKPDYVTALFDKARADLAFEEACADRALEKKKEGSRKA